ncbi:MAG: MSMEG_6728 family protein [Dehalococcoidia bacterium]
MQTFLPYADFNQSARALDNKRLGKQRVEAWQIHRAITDPTYGWQHHPAVRMWRGYDGALMVYGIHICKEWKQRGFNDSLLARFTTNHDHPQIFPWWFGSESFHSKHRSILLAKNYAYYSKFGWAEKPAQKVNGKWSYIWPNVKLYQ